MTSINNFSNDENDTQVSEQPSMLESNPVTILEDKKPEEEISVVRKQRAIMSGNNEFENNEQPEVRKLRNGRFKAPAENIAAASEENTTTVKSNPQSTSLVSNSKPPADSEEMRMEKWLKDRNNPSQVGHFDLAYSGLNIAKFALLEGRVGKFKFVRTISNAAWNITIEESEKK